MPKAINYYRKSVDAILDEILFYRKKGDKAVVKRLQKILVELRRSWQQVLKEKKRKKGR